MDIQYFDGVVHHFPSRAWSFLTEFSDAGCLS